MTDARPTVSVVLPSYRRVHRLAPLITEYLAQGADEVIVVLDGRHEGWRAELAADPRLMVVELPVNRGLALARIAGLEAAESDVILMADDDVEPRPGLLERHREFHAHHVDHVLLGWMPVALPARRSADDAPTYLYARDYDSQATLWRRSGSDVILGSLWGGNVSLPRELYARAERTKPSQRLDYNEDLDLGLRLRELGAVGVFDEHASARHHHARDLAGFIAECRARGSAMAHLESRWGALADQLVPLVRIPADYNPIAARVQRSIASRDHPGPLEGAIVAAYRLTGILRIWAVQDALTRLLRRGLVMRGYRVASERAASDPSADVGGSYERRA